MAMTQEPIDWRYRFHIFLAYVSSSTSQWEAQDPKMEVRKRSIFLAI